MKKQFFLFYLVSLTIYLTVGGLIPPTGASPSHSSFDGWANKRHSDQFPNRRYARSFAANLNVGQPRTVRMIYFLPNDRPYQAEVVQRMKEEIRTVQTFFADQMEVHGYGRRTFRVETDSQDEPMVHRVDGQHPFSYYDNTLGTAVTSELKETYDFDANIYFIVLGTDALRQGNGQLALGVGHQYTKNGRDALVPNEFSWDLVAHELGHSFGLNHDFRDNTFIMSYGFTQSRLSACAADFLSVHSYFNPATPIEREQPPTIELISPRRYPPGSTGVPVRVKVSDSDGLHQVLLHGVGALQMCRQLTGAKDTVVEFDYNGGFGSQGFESLSTDVAHGIRVDVVDTDGNESLTFFTLVETSPYHIATLPGHTERSTSVAFLPDGILVSLGEYRGIETQPGWVRLHSRIKLWDLATRTNIATFENGGSGMYHSMAVSSDGTTLAVVDWETIKLWDIAAQAQIAHFSAHTLSVNNLLFSPEGAILPVAFSPDGSILASSAGGTVKLWDMTTRHAIPYSNHPIGILLHRGGVSSVAFSPDGSILASASWAEVELWDVTTRAHFANLGHPSKVVSMAFSPDGMTLACATGWNSGTIELWDMTMLMDVRVELTAEIDIPDPNLRSAIKPSGAPITMRDMARLTQLYAPEAGISNLIGLGYATNLTRLVLYINSISDPSPVAGLTDLTYLDLAVNSISDISALVNLTNLTHLQLPFNSISDLSPLVANTGLGAGDEVDVRGNPLSYQSIYAHIPTLQRRGVTVKFDDTAAKPPDVNGDGNVDVLDLLMIVSKLGDTGTQIATDISGDGVVDILDLVLVAGTFESAAAAPSVHSPIPETITAVEVQKWLTEARSLEMRDPIIKRGIMMLEQLLVSLTPTETELLANYPNPFNPETWIPYRLADDVFVTLTIYDLDGRVVRTLNVGHRIAAVYESRSKAIYWDGRNNLGEPVASGLFLHPDGRGLFPNTQDAYPQVSR